MAQAPVVPSIFPSVLGPHQSLAGLLSMLCLMFPRKCESRTLPVVHFTTTPHPNMTWGEDNGRAFNPTWDNQTWQGVENVTAEGTNVTSSRVNSTYSPEGVSTTTASPATPPPPSSPTASSITPPPKTTTTASPATPSMPVPQQAWLHACEPRDKTQRYHVTGSHVGEIVSTSRAVDPEKLNYKLHNLKASVENINQRVVQRIPRNLRERYGSCIGLASPWGHCHAIKVKATSTASNDTDEVLKTVYSQLSQATLYAELAEQNEQRVHPLSLREDRQIKELVVNRPRYGLHKLLCDIEHGLSEDIPRLSRDLLLPSCASIPRRRRDIFMANVKLMCLINNNIYESIHEVQKILN